MKRSTCGNNVGLKYAETALKTGKMFTFPYVSVNSKSVNPPPGIPRVFDQRVAPNSREFDPT